MDFHQNEVHSVTLCFFMIMDLFHTFQIKLNYEDEVIIQVIVIKQSTKHM